MFSSPFGYQRPSSYYDSDSYYPRQWGYPQQYRRSAGIDPEEANARARALAAQRARRAQWLPDEVDEPEDDWEYRSLPPREQMLLEAARRRQLLEQQQRQQEHARQRALEEARWQQQLEQRQREEDEKRQRILEEQRKIQQLKREREEARLRAAEAARQQSRARSQSRQRQGSPPHSPSSHKSFPIHIDGHLPTSSKPQSPPPKPPTPRPQYDERHEEAASKIQNQYRIHRSFQTIQSLEKQFQDAQSRFIFPSSIDFQRPGSENEGHNHISVPASRDPNAPLSEDMDVDGQPEGKLAYTSNNFGLNAHLDGMLKLLTKLDGVESWGEKRVRERRRNVVKEIEEEMARVDRYWKGAWSDYLAAQRQEVDASKEQNEEEKRQQPRTGEQAEEEEQDREEMQIEEEVTAEGKVPAEEENMAEVPQVEDQGSPVQGPESAASSDQPSDQTLPSVADVKTPPIPPQIDMDQLEQAWL